MTRVRARWPFLRILPRWIAAWIQVELLPALRDPAPPALGLRRPDVRVERGRVYAHHDRCRLRLDIYRARREPAGPCPAIVNVHGGAWVLGSRREQARPLLCHLAAQGWIAFNIDYRLSPGANLDEQVTDIKRAIAWIREHADELGVDPGFIALTGGSAGGHLTALVALTAGNPSRQPGFEDADTSIQAAVPCYGIYQLPGEFTDRWPTLGRMIARHVVQADPDTNPERFTRVSPSAHVHAGAPPFLIVHGSDDSLVPVGEARRFADALWRASSAPVRYLEIAGAEHAFDLILSHRTQAVLAEVETFLGAARATHQYAICQGA